MRPTSVPSVVAAGNPLPPPAGPSDAELAEAIGEAPALPPDAALPDELAEEGAVARAVWLEPYIAAARALSPRTPPHAARGGGRVRAGHGPRPAGLRPRRRPAAVPRLLPGLRRALHPLQQDRGPGRAAPAAGRRRAAPPAAARQLHPPGAGGRPGPARPPGRARGRRRRAGAVAGAPPPRGPAGASCATSWPGCSRTARGTTTPACCPCCSSWTGRPRPSTPT